jgi:hypothetical protein
MFCLFTLPWYCKGFVVTYDVLRCLLYSKAPELVPGAAVGTMLEKTISVVALQTMIAVLLLAPSVCHSVADRVKTNTFCSQIALLLSVYLLLIRCMRTGLVSAEHACFALQFCSCYLFCCFWQATKKHRGLLVGGGMVQLASAAGMVIFPVLYSHLLQDCMHVSPYALVFVFAGEVSGCICVCASQLLVAFECVVDALYARLVEA